MNSSFKLFLYTMKVKSQENQQFCSLNFSEVIWKLSISRCYQLPIGRLSSECRPSASVAIIILTESPGVGHLSLFHKLQCAFWLIWLTTLFVRDCTRVIQITADNTGGLKDQGLSSAFSCQFFNVNVDIFLHIAAIGLIVERLET